MASKVGKEPFSTGNDGFPEAANQDLNAGDDAVFAGDNFPDDDADSSDDEFADDYLSGEPDVNGKTSIRGDRRDITAAKAARQAALYARFRPDGEDLSGVPMHKRVHTHDAGDVVSRNAARERDQKREDADIRRIIGRNLIPKPSNKPSESTSEKINKVIRLSQLSLSEFLNDLGKDNPESAQELSSHIHKEGLSMAISDLLVDQNLNESNPDFIQLLISALYTMAEDMPD